MKPRGFAWQRASVTNPLILVATGMKSDQIFGLAAMSCVSREKRKDGRANNSFKPTPFRCVACVRSLRSHTSPHRSRRGLTQALGPATSDIANFDTKATNSRMRHSPSFYLLVGLATLMLLPLGFAISRLVEFLQSGNIEELMLVGFTAVYSTALCLPYLVTLAVSWRSHSKSVRLITATPFIAMAVVVAVATTMGLPW